MSESFFESNAALPLILLHFNSFLMFVIIGLNKEIVVYYIIFCLCERNMREYNKGIVMHHAIHIRICTHVKKNNAKSTSEQH